MLEKSQRDLRRSVRRKLALRLIAVSLPLALLAALGAFLAERDRIGDDVLSFTVMQASLFNAEQGRLLDRLATVDREDLEAAMAEFASRRQGGHLGRFDAVEIHRPSGERIGLLVRPDTLSEATVERLFASESFQSERGPWSNVLRIEGAPHLLVQMPLVGGSGMTVGWMRGIFRPAEHVIEGARRRALRSALAVGAVVLAIGLVIWPSVRRLLDRLGRLSGSLLEANLGTLDALGRALAKRDGDTEEHSLRVTIVSVLLAQELGLERDQMQSLIKGASLHDVGKIAIRDEILLKPGKLTDEEYEIMKSHVDHGVDIVSRSAWLESARDVVRYHHEKFSGAGYQKGLSGEEIPLAARIFAIVDVFDALASSRPYKEAMPFEDTMAVLEEGRGTHFDPRLLDVFARIAPDVFERFYGRDAEELGRDLDDVVDRYFSGGLDSLEVAN
jgi:putative nucleotidyltransferase with HDIG domain